MIYHGAIAKHHFEHPCWRSATESRNHSHPCVERSPLSRGITRLFVSNQIRDSTFQNTVIHEGVQNWRRYTKKQPESEEQQEVYVEAHDCNRPLTRVIHVTRHE